jgi:hypothetical protein
LGAQTEGRQYSTNKIIFGTMIKTKSKKRLWILFVQLTVNKEGKRSHNKRTKGKLIKKIEQREKKEK